MLSRATLADVSGEERHANMKQDASSFEDIQGYSNLLQTTHAIVQAQRIPYIRMVANICK